MRSLMFQEAELQPQGAEIPCGHHSCRELHGIR
jgi:hypothetical protein